MAILPKNHGRTDSQVRRLFRLFSARSFGSEKSSFKLEHLKKTSNDACSNDDDNVNDTPCVQRESSRPRVCFDHNVRVYPAKHISNAKDRSNRWYTKLELEAFELEARCTVEIIVQAEILLSDQPSWQMSLQRMYQLYADGFIDYDAEMTYFHGKSATARIGLDSLVGNLASGTGPSTKYKRLLGRLRELQDIPDLEQRSRLMSQASLSISRSSCLCALHLARWWASQFSAKSM